MACLALNRVLLVFPTCNHSYTVTSHYIPHLFFCRLRCGFVSGRIQTLQRPSCAFAVVFLVDTWLGLQFALGALSLLICEFLLLDCFFRRRPTCVLAYSSTACVSSFFSLLSVTLHFLHLWFWYVFSAGRICRESACVCVWNFVWLKFLKNGHCC